MRKVKLCNENFPRLEMQIPRENAYTGAVKMPNEKLKDFLKQEFEFPSKNFDEINQFINKDSELKKIIYDLPQEISSKLHYNKISLDFMKETDPNEKILEIVIYSRFDEDILLEKEDMICDKFIDRYPKTILEYIILVDPYNRCQLKAKKIFELLNQLN